MVGTAIKSILSSITANIYGLHIPDSRGSKWIIHTMISRQPHDAKEAVSDLDKYLYQIDSYARTESDMDTLAESVKSALDRYSGTVSGTIIDNVFFAGESDSVEFIEGEESKEEYYRRMQEYEIWVKS